MVPSLNKDVLMPPDIRDKFKEKQKKDNKDKT